MTRVYRVGIRRRDDQEHEGYTYLSSQREVARLNREEDKKGNDIEVEVIELAPTKSGILRALNLHGSHPDNG